MNVFFEIFTTTWDFYEKSAVYMLFGFLMAGLLSVFIRSDKIKKLLGTGRIRPVFLSAMMGIPLPLCSCGVVPAAAGLQKQGANKGAVLSFLIATPETGVDSIPVTYALLDPFMTVIRPVAAFVTALISGIAENIFGESVNRHSAKNENDSPLKSDGCDLDNSMSQGVGEKNSLKARLSSGLRFAFVDLLADIGPWFVIGVLLAGLITYLLPENFINTFFSDGFSAKLVMLFAGVPMYICATSSTPIAAALILKGLSPGAALVFLLSGPATNIASLTMVAKMLGKRSLLIYLGSIASCALAFGVITDMIYAHLGVSARAIVGQTTELMPQTLELFAALLLTVLIANAMRLEYSERKSCRCDCTGRVVLSQKL